jgi:hypothetical protein
MSKHITMVLKDVPESHDCSIRELVQHFNEHYANAPEDYDIRECFYCIHFRGIQCGYPRDNSVFLLCAGIPPPKDEPNLAGGRIQIHVE